MYFVATLIILFIYRRGIGWLDNPSWSIQKKLGLKNSIRLKLWRPPEPVKLSPHWKIRLYLEGAVIVSVITEMLSLIIYPPAWTKGIAYFLLVARQTPNGAHITSYVLVFVLVLIASLKFDDSLKALFFGGLMVFVHEGLWFPFYYLTNWGFVNALEDLAFFLWILSLYWVATKFYRLKINKVGVVVFLGYLIGWLSIGFPVTVKNVSKFAVGYQTPYYNSFFVNSIETVSWILIFAVFVWSLKENEGDWPQVKDFLRSIKKRFV